MSDVAKKLPIAVFDPNDEYNPLLLVDVNEPDSVNWWKDIEYVEFYTIDQVVKYASEHPDTNDQFVSHINSRSQYATNDFIFVYDEETLRSLLNTLEI